MVIKHQYVYIYASSMARVDIYVGINPIPRSYKVASMDLKSDWFDVELSQCDDLDSVTQSAGVSCLLVFCLSTRWPQLTARPVSRADTVRELCVCSYNPFSARDQLQIPSSFLWENRVYVVLTLSVRGFDFHKNVESTADPCLQSLRR